MANTRENPTFLSSYFTPEKSTDLYKYPVVRLKPQADQEFTFGDLHANAMYFLHLLIYIGAVDFNDKDENERINKYNTLLEIYLRSPGNAANSTVVNNAKLMHDYGLYREGMHFVLREDDITKFQEIIGTLEITNPIALIRLLGDEFADAGQCDEFIQTIITQLDVLKIPNESLLSNHGIERLEAFEKPQEKFYPPRLKAKVGMIALGVAQRLATQNKITLNQKTTIKKTLASGQVEELVKINLDLADQLITQGCLQVSFLYVEEKAHSMVATQQLLERNILKYDEIKAAHDHHYKLKLKVLSYTLSADKKDIVIYSHAGIGLQTIRALAEKLGIKYQAHTALALAATIDTINARFQEHVKNKTVHTLYDSNALKMAYHGAAQFCKQTVKITPPTNEQLIHIGIPEETVKNCNVTNNPFEFLMWYRRHEDDRPALKTSSNYLQGAFYGGFNISFVHGHDSEDPQAANVKLPMVKSHIYNLNNMIGRSVNHHKGSLFILAARNHDKTQVLKLAEGFDELKVNENNGTPTQTTANDDVLKQFTMV